MKNIKKRTLTCNDASCPDFGKSIEVYDGEYNGHTLHLEKLDDGSFNLLIDNKTWKFGITYDQLKEYGAEL